MKYFFILLFYSLFLPLYQTTQAQPGWNVLNSNTTINLKSVYFPTYDTGYVVGNSALILKTTTAGLDWMVLSHPYSFSFNDVFFFNPDEGLAVGESGFIIRTTDGGTNWSLISSGVSDELLSVTFIDSFGICGARSQTILYSTNAGITWNISQSGYIGGGFWGAVMLSPQIGFLGGENSIFQPLVGKTTDSGQNWDFSAFYLNSNEGRITGIDFTDQFIGYASCRVWDGRGAISKTTDNGNNWSTIFFSSVLNSIDFPISNASLIGYAVGDAGTVLKTYNTGISWFTQTSGTNKRLNKVFFMDLDFGYIVGDEGTILKTTTGGEPVTNIGENESGTGEQFTFKLYQNTPNPFSAGGRSAYGGNPSTTIRFTILDFPAGNGTGRFTTLKVYDVLGNEVATLVNEEKPVGHYEVEFDATGLPSGIYYYQLRTNSFIETRKMILTK